MKKRISIIVLSLVLSPITYAHDNKLCETMVNLYSLIYQAREYGVPLKEMHKIADEKHLSLDMHVAISNIYSSPEGMSDVEVSTIAYNSCLNHK